MSVKMQEKFMREALKEAQKALSKEEVPVGAIIVKDGKIIARAHNIKESKKDSFFLFLTSFLINFT